MLGWLCACVGIWFDVCEGGWRYFVVCVLLFSGRRSCPLAVLGGRLWVQFCGLPGGNLVLAWCVLWMGCVGVDESI